jgi:hypothetical protein
VARVSCHHPSRPRDDARASCDMISNNGVVTFPLLDAMDQQWQDARTEMNHLCGEPMLAAEYGPFGETKHAYQDRALHSLLCCRLISFG